MKNFEDSFLYFTYGYGNNKIGIDQVLNTGFASLYSVQDYYCTFETNDK